MEIVSVHPCPPRSANAACWWDGLEALPPPAPGRRGPVRVLAGDFNATLDHVPMQRILGRGYRDAADVTGDGLAMTWPNAGVRLNRVPPVAIDHVPADSRVAIRSSGTRRLPGTDHSAVHAVLTLPGA